MFCRARHDLLSLFAGLSLITGLAGCGDDDMKDPVEGPHVRGRVTDVQGQALADVRVAVDGKMVQTDKQGRFDAKVRDDADEVQVAVDSKGYSSGTVPVKVAAGADSHVEVSVKARDSMMVEVASDGVTAKGKDGLLVKVPADGLNTKTGEPVTGEVEVAYTVVKDPADITAAPGRMESDAHESLEGFGFAEVRFFQGGEELVLVKTAHFEIPMSAEVATENGDKVKAYGLGGSDKRWKAAGEATVQDGKLVIDTDTAWLGAARALPIDSCMSGRLLAGGSGALHTTIRAARTRGLSLVQADTGSDGSFCVPVTPNDDWHVSTYYDDGADGLGLEVDLNSSDATGMCGGDGCKSVGDVELPGL